MSFRKSMSEKVDYKNYGNSWMVSFGDLLTLLLCFVLSLVSYGHIKPINQTGEKEEKISNINLLSQEEKNLKKSHKNGTVVASYKRKVFFSLADFDDTGTLNHVAQKRMKKFIEKRIAEEPNQKLILRSCADDWFSALQRTLILRQDALKNNVSSKLLLVETLGNGCEELQQSKTENFYPVASLETESL